SYLDDMEKAAAAFPAIAEPSPIVLAALGPQMTALGGERSWGVHPYNVTPEHTASARAIIGPNKWLCVEQKVLLVAEASKAREIARQAMAFYLPLVNYRNAWKRLGFTDQDLENGGSDKVLDAMVAWGTETAIQNRFQSHFDAGAIH